MNVFIKGNFAVLLTLLCVCLPAQASTAYTIDETVFFPASAFPSPILGETGPITMSIHLRISGTPTVEPGLAADGGALYGYAPSDVSDFSATFGASTWTGVNLLPLYLAMPGLDQNSVLLFDAPIDASVTGSGNVAMGLMAGPAGATPTPNGALFAVGGGNLGGSLQEFGVMDLSTYDIVYGSFVSINVAPVPLPASVYLFSMGCLALVGLGFRGRNNHRGQTTAFA